MPWLYKQNGSENWWVGFRLNGQQFRRSTGTADKKQAERELEKLNAVQSAHKAGSLTEDFVAMLTGKNTSGQSLRLYVQQWLDECKSLSPQTVKKYKAVTTEFCDWLNATDEAPLLNAVSTDLLASFLRKKRAETSTATAKAARRCLGAFFSYAVDNQVLPASPLPSAKSLKFNKASQSQRRAFTLVELSALYKVAPNGFWKFMIKAGYFTGQRLGDLVSLRWGAVDLQRAQIRLTQSKTGKSVVVPLRDELAAMILELKHAAGIVKPGDAIWPEQSERYAKQGAGVFSNEFYSECLVPAGLALPRSKSHKAKNGNGEVTDKRGASVVSFHSLRHSFVTHLQSSGAGKAVTMELAGHSDERVNSIYTHVSELEMSQAVKQLPGLNND